MSLNMVQCPEGPLRAVIHHEILSIIRSRTFSPCVNTLSAVNTVERMVYDGHMLRWLQELFGAPREGWIIWADHIPVFEPDAHFHVFETREAAGARVSAGAPGHMPPWRVRRVVSSRPLRFTRTWPFGRSTEPMHVGWGDAPTDVRLDDAPA